MYLPLTIRSVVKLLSGFGAILVAIWLFIVMAFPVWSKTSYLDLNSGAIKREQRVVNILVSTRDVDSAFEALAGPLSSMPRQPHWVIVDSQSSASSISPHYRFHGTPYDLERLALYSQSLDQAERDLLLKKVLETLRKGDSRTISRMARDGL